MMRYRPELDGIRAFAVLAVIAFHFGFPYADAGWMGVDVFFVLSGYLITSLLLSEQERFGSISLGRFYSRRILRLYPALIVVLVLGAFFVSALIGPTTLTRYAEVGGVVGTYLSDFVAGSGHYSALGAFGPTWSLAVEEHFYLLWPPALILLLRYRRNVLLWLTVLGGMSLASLVVLSFVIGRDGFIDAAYYLPTSRFWTLLLGCAVAVMLHRGVRVRVLERSRAGVALAVAVVALSVVTVHFGRYPNLAWESPAIGLLAAALVWHVTTAADSAVGSLLAWHPLVWIGRRSYGIYLYHVPVILILQLDLLPRFPVPHTVLRIVSVGVSIGVAALSYRFVELPFLRLKKRLSAADRRPSAAPDAVSTSRPTTGIA